MKTSLPLALAGLVAASTAGAQTPPPAGDPVALAPPLAPVAPAPEPSSGILWILGGSGLLLGGAGNLASAGLCEAGRVPTAQRPACLGTSIAVGLALVGGGIPLVVIGAGKRSAWLEWGRGARVAVLPGGASANWGTSW